MLTRRQNLGRRRMLVFATGKGIRVDGQDESGIEEEKNEVRDKEREKR